MSRRAKLIAAAVVLAGGAALAVLLNTLGYGFSALDEPTAAEAFMARTMRRYAVPASLRERKNPIPLTPDVMAQARAHFADHCATCHGNDGRGTTFMGPRFYPKVPDMTLPATQSQSDGELFATIENGIRLTGMPGWGDGSADSAHGSWQLVHFIRHLTELTPEELSEMEMLNPKSPTDSAVARDEDAFLAGEDPPAAAPPRAHGH